MYSCLFITDTNPFALHRKEVISFGDRENVDFSLKLFSVHYFLSEVNMKLLKNFQIPYH